MKFSELFIKRPVLTTMLAVAIVTFGVFSFIRLGVDLYPDVDVPIVTVQTVLKGASPEEVESSVTKVIEEAVNTVSGIEDIVSTSYEGLSMVMVEFELEKNADIAAQEIRDKISTIMSKLPDGTETPVVNKIDFGAMPVMSISVASERNIIELTQLVKKQIKEVIETVNGVGSVDIVGGREREIHVLLNPLKMAAYDVSSFDVTNALKQQNVEIPGGNIEQEEFDYVLRTMGRIPKVEDFKDIIVKNSNGKLIKLSDIAEIKDTGEDIESVSYLNGRPAVTLTVKKQSGTNTVAVIDKVKEKLKEIEKTLPKDLDVRVVGDQSIFIKGSLHAVYEHLILGALLASLVILFFIGDVRSTIISAIAIPVSVIGSFALMELSNFTLNNVTLLALVVGVGLVIDDAIVMIENIHRHLEKEDIDSKDAAITGSSEIGFAVLTISISLLAIFVPLAYMGGMVGRFLKHFGLTLAYAVAISTLIALTITPAYSDVFLKKLKKTSFMKFVDRLNSITADVYLKILKFSINHIKTMVFLGFVTMFSTVLLLKFIGKDFLPVDDTSMFQVNVKAEEGTNLKKMKKLLFKIDREIKDNLPYIKTTLITAGISEAGTPSKNEGYIFYEIVPIHERKEGLDEIMKKVRKILLKHEGLRTAVRVAGEGSVTGMKDYALEYVITGPELDVLQNYSQKIVEELKKIPGAVDVDTSFNNAKPEYRVIINRDKAYKLGAEISEIAMTLRTLVSGKDDITKYKESGELYEVRVRLDERWRNNPDVIGAIPVPVKDNKVIRLDSIADIVKGFGPTQIDRYNRQRKISIYANTEGNASLSQLLKICDDTFKKINKLPQYKAEPTGMAKEFGRMLKSFLMAFIFAFIFVYIVLAAQFESFTYPVSIIVILPLTIPFALISLFILGENMSIFSLMGMFMLFGIVKKNSILQVDYTNTLRSRGFDRETAILEANRVRLRPILMTTAVLVFAMIPTALGKGPGASMRQSLASVIIIGQVLSLLITLLMTPVTYIIMDDLQRWLRKKFLGLNSH